MKTFRKICICCPAGCHLTVTLADDGEIQVNGNNCPRGDIYARQELRDPRRTVTATVAAAGDPHCRIPVKSSEPVPLALIDGLLAELYTLAVPLPVTMGQSLLPDYRQTGIDIVATRTMMAEGGPERARSSARPTCP